MKQMIKEFASCRILVTGISIFFLTACKKDLITSNQPVQLKTTAGINAPTWGGCQCNIPGYGCQTSTCAASCELYCNTKHGHGHK